MNIIYRINKTFLFSKAALFFNNSYFDFLIINKRERKKKLLENVLFKRAQLLFLLKTFYTIMFFVLFCQSIMK